VSKAKSRACAPRGGTRERPEKPGDYRRFLFAADCKSYNDRRRNPNDEIRMTKECSNDSSPKETLFHERFWLRASFVIRASCFHFGAMRIAPSSRIVSPFCGRQAGRRLPAPDSSICRTRSANLVRCLKARKAKVGVKRAKAIVDVMAQMALKHDAIGCSRPPMVQAKIESSVAIGQENENINIEQIKASLTGFASKICRGRI
jgi:hypothetical protein